jgi:transposase
VPVGDLAHFINDVTDELDLSAIESVYEEELRGYPPYHPRMMTKLWLYAYAVGQTSSRKVARLVQRDLGFMMLAAGNQPDFRTLALFRQRHLKALSGLFKQVLKLCRKRGLLKLRHVAIDGTKVKANASKHSAMSYGRMQQEDERISREIDAWFKKADQVDADEDKLYGGEKRGDELPEELQTAEGRRKAIREAMAELEKEAEEAGAEAPENKAQRNFTDSESRIMHSSEGAFHPGLQRPGGGRCRAPDHRRRRPQQHGCRFTAADSDARLGARESGSQSRRDLGRRRLLLRSKSRSPRRPTGRSLHRRRQDAPQL